AQLTKLVSGELDFPNQRVANVLERAAFARRHAAWARCRSWLENIEARPSDDTELRKWLKAIERDSTDEMTHEANDVAIKQWIWQVKRGIIQAPVVWHVAPIFWSQENGTGKSYNLRRLYAPLAAFARTLDVSDLSEKFGGPLMSETLIAFLDE